MNLTIDIGNSRVKLGFFEAESLVSSQIIDSSHQTAIIQLIQSGDIEAAILSSVQKIDREFENVLRQNVLLTVLTKEAKLPFDNQYDTPETLGKDRLAAVAGAQALFPEKNLLVIDAGTCITYDFITASGAYLGGAISPGVSIRFRSLNEYTGRLPLIDKSGNSELIGATTKESIESGVINGVTEELNGIINRYRERYRNMAVVMTGGDSQFFETSINCPIFADPNLVLIGLNRILRYNAS